MNSNLPCIIGVAQKTWRQEDGDAPHPLYQNVEVSSMALADGGNAAIIDCIDEVDVVRSLSWHYDDLPGALAAALGLHNGERQLVWYERHQPATFY